MPRKAKRLIQIESIARQHCPRAIMVLAGIMDNPRSSEQARIAAANSLINRGWGLPKAISESEHKHTYVVEVPTVLESSVWAAKYGREDASDGKPNQRTNNLFFASQSNDINGLGSTKHNWRIC